MPLLKVHVGVRISLPKEEDPVEGVIILSEDGATLDAILLLPLLHQGDGLPQVEYALLVFGHLRHDVSKLKVDCGHVRVDLATDFPVDFQGAFIVLDRLRPPVIRKRTIESHKNKERRERVTFRLSA